MLSARVIPCLDVDAGRVVKGVRFKELRDAGDPVLVAQAYEEQGADELVFLDITASSDERESMREVVERTVATCFMPVTVGGGIRSLGMAFHCALPPSSYPTLLSHPCFGSISDAPGMENLIQYTVSPCAPRSGGASPEGQTALGGLTEWERDETC